MIEPHFSVTNIDSLKTASKCKKGGPRIPTMFIAFHNNKQPAISVQTKNLLGHFIPSAFKMFPNKLTFHHPCVYLCALQSYTTMFYHLHILTIAFQALRSRPSKWVWRNREDGNDGLPKLLHLIASANY